jgi:hypothetical protein
MHKRDYLVKQFEEFGKVMAVIFGLKKDGHYPEFLKLLNETVQKFTPLELEYVETLDNENIISLLTVDKKLNDDQLKILADLLYEKADYYLTQSNEIDATNCYKKSHGIYLFLKNNATLTYSLDMHYKLEVLSKIL